MDVVSTFNLDTEDPILHNSFYPFSIANVINGAHAFVTSSWNAFSFDAGGNSWMWRYQAILSNPTGVPNIVIAGLRPSGVLTGLTADSFSTSVVAALTPFILDYVRNAVSGSREFSRPSKNLLAIGDAFSY